MLWSKYFRAGAAIRLETLKMTNNMVKGLESKVAVMEDDVVFKISIPRLQSWNQSVTQLELPIPECWRPQKHAVTSAAVSDECLSKRRTHQSLQA